MTSREVRVVGDHSVAWISAVVGTYVPLTLLVL